VNGFEVDFFWPDLGLVVETDGLRYHRTPSAQLRDARRDRAHVMAGMTPLRFTHYEVRYEPAVSARSWRRRLRCFSSAFGFDHSPLGRESDATRGRGGVTL
jgi:very-short-patch-repair endonuclease